MCGCGVSLTDTGTHTEKQACEPESLPASRSLTGTTKWCLMKRLCFCPRRPCLQLRTCACDTSLTCGRRKVRVDAVGPRMSAGLP